MESKENMAQRPVFEAEQKQIKSSEDEENSQLLDSASKVHLPKNEGSMIGSCVGSAAFQLFATKSSETNLLEEKCEHADLLQFSLVGKTGHLIRKAWTFFNLMVYKNGEQSPVLDFTTSLQPIKMQYLLQCHIDTVNKHLNDTKYRIKIKDTGTAVIEVLSATDQQHDDILGEVVIALDEIAKTVYTKLFPVSNEDIRLVLLQDSGRRLQDEGLDVDIYDDGKSSIVLVGQNESLGPAFDLLKKLTDDKQKRTRSISIDTKLNTDLIHYLGFKNVLESKADVKVTIDFTDQKMTFVNSSRDDIEKYMQIMQKFLSNIIVIKWVCPEIVLKLLQLDKVRRYIQDQLVQRQIKCFLDFEHNSSVVCYSLSSTDGKDAFAMVKTSIQTIRIHKKSASSCEVRDVMNKFNNKFISNTTEEDIVEVTATNDATAEIMLAMVQLDCPTERTRTSLQTGKLSENQSEYDSFSSFPSNLTEENGKHKISGPLLSAPYTEVKSQIDDTVGDKASSSSSSGSFTKFYETDMAQEEYDALKYFLDKDSSSEDIKSKMLWETGKMCLTCEDFSFSLNIGSVYDYVKSKVDHIKKMIKQEIPVESLETERKIRDNLSQLHKDCDGIFFHLSSEERLLTVWGSSYENVQIAKHKVAVILGQFKESGTRRHRRFPADTDNTSTIKSLDYRDDTYSILPSNLSSSNTVHGAAQGNFRTPSGLQVKVYKGNILQLDVDCIVNAANEYLAHGGGIAEVIARAAGPEFDRQSREYIRQYGSVHVGECCYTSAGNLHYKCVIHTVGPRWNAYNDKQQCLDDVCSAVEGTLNMAEQLQLKSIAIPPISAGIFGVPIGECALQYLRAVQHFNTNKVSVSSYLKEIHFIDKDEWMCRPIQQTFENFFNGHHSNVIPESTIVLQNFDKTIHGVSPSKKCFKKALSNPSAKLQSISKSMSKDAIFEFEASDQLKVLVYKADIIEEYRVEAIVCPEDRDFSGLGWMARTLMDKGGSKYKQYRKCFTRLALKEVESMNIESVLFPFKQVFYVCSPRWDCTSAVRPYQFETDLKETVGNILQKAEIKLVKSVSIPFLGKGKNPSYPTPFKTCCECMVAAVCNFIKTQKAASSLREVHFVLCDEVALSVLKEECRSKFS